MSPFRKTQEPGLDSIGRFVRSADSAQVIFIILGIGFFFLPLIQISTLYDGVALPRHVFLAAITIIILTVYITPWNREPLQIKWHLILGLILLFGFVTLISLFWSIDKWNTALSLLYLIPMIVLCIVLSQLANIRYIEALIAAISAGTVFAAVIGIQQYFNYNPLHFNQVNVPASTFLNKNIAAQYFSLVIPLLSVAVLYTRKSVVKIFYATAFGMSLSFVLIAKTRGTLLGLTVALLVFLAFIIFDKRTKQLVGARLKSSFFQIVFGIALVFTISIATSIYGTKGHWNVSNLYGEKIGRSAESRLITYKNSLAMIQSRPLLGVGYNAFARGFRPFAANPYPNPVINEIVSFRFAHNAPLQYIAELGVVAGLLPIVIFSFLLFLGFKTLRRISDSHAALILLSLLLAILAGAAHAMVSFPLRMPTSAAIFWACCGMILALVLRHYPLVSHLTLRRPGKALTGVIGVLFLSFALYLFPIFIKGQNHLLAAYMLQNMKDCEAAKVAIDRAYGLIPWDLSVRNRFAIVYTYCPLKNHDRFEAIDSLLSRDPVNPLAYLTRAQLYLHAGDTTAAAQDFYKVVELVPHRPSGYLGLARLAQEKGEIEQAERFLEIAAELAPDDHEIQDQLKNLYLDKQNIRID